MPANLERRQWRLSGASNGTIAAACPLTPIAVGIVQVFSEGVAAEFPDYRFLNVAVSSSFQGLASSISGTIKGINGEPLNKCRSTALNSTNREEPTCLTTARRHPTFMETIRPPHRLKDLQTEKNLPRLLSSERGCQSWSPTPERRISRSCLRIRRFWS
jgi:hypothetical protein